MVGAFLCVLSGSVVTLYFGYNPVYFLIDSTVDR